jgi:hypothetical protein
MRSVRLGIVAAIIAVISTGCDGGGQTETTMPTTAPALPPETDQMKKDMEARFHTGPGGTRSPYSSAKK